LRTGLAGAAFVVGSVLTSGCSASPSSQGQGKAGTEHSSPQQLLNLATADMQSAHSVHCNFFGGSNSESLDVNANVFKNGDLSGTLSLDGYPSDIVVIKGTAYERINPVISEKILGLSVVQAEQLAGEWISGPNSSSNGSDGQLHFAVGTSVSYQSLQQIFHQNFGDLTSLGTSKIGNVKSHRFHSSRGATLWVAAGRDPLPVRISATASNGSLVATLTSWNEGRVPTIPANAVPITSFPFGIHA
jgi:hypothetical protein